MPTAADWVADARALLMSGTQAERNTLAAPYAAGSGGLTFSAALGGIVSGIRLSIGLNTFYVRAVTQAGLSAVVLGGQEGTTDANAPSGSLVWVAPRYTDYEILKALNSELRSLSAPGNGLYQVRTTDLTYANGAVGYDLAGTDLIDVLEVRAQASGTLKDWPRVPKSLWRLDQSADTAVFPSGRALQIFGDAWAGYKVRILYRSGFTDLTDLSTDVATTGLPASAYDIPALGAAVRLVSPREIKRNQTEAQPEPRRATEVPAGAVAGSMRAVAALRAARIADEAQKLDARYPLRRW